MSSRSIQEIFKGTLDVEASYSIFVCLSGEQIQIQGSFEAFVDTRSCHHTSSIETTVSGVSCFCRVRRVQW